MHHDSPYNSKKSTPDVDLTQTGKREQCVSDVRLEPCVMLMAYDPLGIHCRSQRRWSPAYDWRGQR